MPTPEEIQREQERLELIQRQNAAAKELVSTYEKMSKTVGSLTDEEKEILDIAKKISKSASDIEKSTSKRLDKTSSIKDLNRSLQALQQSQLKNADIAAKLEAERTNHLTKASELYRSAVKQRQSILDLEGTTSELIARRNAAERAGNADVAAELTRQIKANEFNIKQKEKRLAATTKEAQKERDLIKSLDETRKAHQNIVEEQQKEIKATEEELSKRKQLSFLSVLEEKFNIQKLKDLTSIAGMFKIMLNSALKFNEISVQTSKSLGYGADQADRVAQNLVDIAQHSGNINVTLKNAGEAMAELNNATGLGAEYSADALETQIMLTKQFGLTGEEAAGIYKFSVLTGQSSSEVNKSMVGAFVASRNAFKVGADFKKTIAEAAKVSGLLASNLQNSPKRIIEAIVQSKALGTTLEQTAKQGEALLNFESSIENELKAELLTGKQLNLERARAAALAGDQVTLAEELAKNIGDVAEFDKMNILQKKALAEALGLSGDELAEQVRLQKLAQESGKSLAQITEEEAAEAQKRQAIQDKFNQAIEKLQDLIGNLVAGPLSIFLDGLTNALALVGYILKPIQLIVDLAELIGKKFNEWSKSLGPFGIILKGIAGIAIVLAAYGAYAALAWIPVVGPILGAAAAVAVLAKGFKELAGSKSKAGDMYSPADGKTQVSTKEGGLFELSKNDDLVAGPGLADKVKGDGKGGTISPQIDLSPMIAAINEVKAAVDNLMNRPVLINLDGRQVGSNLTMNTYKTA